MKKLFNKIKEKWNGRIFELSVEVLGRSFIFSCIAFLMQNTHGDNAERLIIIVLLIWTMLPFIRLMDLIFPITRKKKY